MINEHLLKKGLSLNDVEVFTKSFAHPRYLKRFPAYTIACCPFCKAENAEHLNTYSLDYWYGRLEPRKFVFQPDGVVSHCEHFVVAQPFIFVSKTIHPEINYNNLLDLLLHRKSRNFFLPQKPMVLGFVLKNQMAKAVLHVLPICEYTRGDFIPAHLLYLITHFSEQPETAHRAIHEVGMSRAGDDGWPTLTRTANYGEEGRWFNLPYWVERKMLYWVNPYTIEQNYAPQKCLLTGDVNAFPYKNPRELVKMKVAR